MRSELLNLYQCIHISISVRSISLLYGTRDRFIIVCRRIAVADPRGIQGGVQGGYGPLWAVNIVIKRKNGH